MTTKTFFVPDIGCDGCVKTIKNELSAVKGVQSVEGIVDTRMVTVEYGDPATEQQLIESLVEIEYPPANN